MDFEDVRRALRALDVPRDGFEDVLAELDKLKAREPATFARRYLQRKRDRIEIVRRERAA